MIRDPFFFVQGYCPIMKEDKIGFVNLEGKETCPVTYSNADASLILACSAVNSNNEEGFTLIAADGTVTQTDYKDIGRISEDLSGRLFWACDQQDSYGIIDWHGNIVIPFEYSSSDLFYLSDLGTTLLVISESSDVPDEVFTIQYEY